MKAFEQYQGNFSKQGNLSIDRLDKQEPIFFFFNLREKRNSV